MREKCTHSVKEKCTHSVACFWPSLRIKLICIGGVFLFLLVATNLHAQTIVIKGKVTDSQGPLPGVTVKVQETAKIAVADALGNYSISASGNATLIFSSIGYTQQTIKVNNRQTIDVVLVAESQDLGEVIVVGYGTQQKINVVGAVSQVNNAAIIKSGQLNITNALAGMLPGVLTMQRTGTPGADDAEITIRGLSSWNGSQPLVLVDGVERDFTKLDPNEVESISVLKDASSTAVFGAKGANGVLIITTKRGILGKPKLSFSSSYGVDKLARKLTPVDAYTTMSMLNIAFTNQQRFSELIPQYALNQYRNPSSPINSLQYPNVNWYDALTVPFAPTTNANFTIQGGNDFVKYFGSFGYFSQRDFFKHYNQGYDDTRYKYDRFNYRSNLDFTLSKSTKLSFNIGGEVSITNSPSTGNSWRSLNYASPSVAPAFFPAWVLQQVPDPDYPGATGIRLAEVVTGSGQGNPYTYMYSGSFAKHVGSQLFTDLILDQKLDGIIKGLSVKGKVSLSTYYSNTSLTASYGFPVYKLDYTKIGVAGVNPWIRTGQGTEVYTLPQLKINSGSLDGGYYNNLYYEAGLNYENNFGRHRITGLALINRQEKDMGTDFPYYNEALVGRVTYNYSLKYLLEFNVGYTGSERFAPNNRFGLFPSAAFGWVVSEEKFFKNAVPWINKLKLRYSDGIVGSDYSGSRWLYISDYNTSGTSYIVQGPGANVNAQWEVARKKDLGIEIAVFKNLLNFSVDLFDEYRDKMLLQPGNVTILVGNTFKDLNLGIMKKHGIEVDAEFRKSTPSRFNYFIKGNFGFNENRIIYKADAPYTPDYQKAAGRPLGSQGSGQKLIDGGYYSSIDDIHNYAAPITVEKLVLGDYKFLDYNFDGTITTLDKFPIKGQQYPPITYSFSSGFNYKGFDFNFLFQGQLGKYINYNGAFGSEFLKGAYNVHQGQLNYWTPSNPNATHSTMHISAGATDELGWGYTGDQGYNIFIPGVYWRNGNFLRLKDVYAGYTFNSNSFKLLRGVSSLLVYVTVNNLLTFTKLTEVDPETTDFNYGDYPQLTSFKLGVKITF